MRSLKNLHLSSLNIVNPTNYKKQAKFMNINKTTGYPQIKFNLAFLSGGLKLTFLWTPFRLGVQ